jgi:hypothetical protein
VVAEEVAKWRWRRWRRWRWRRWWLVGNLHYEGV